MKNQMRIVVSERPANDLARVQDLGEMLPRAEGTVTAKIKIATGSESRETVKLGATVRFVAWTTILLHETRTTILAVGVMMENEMRG